MEINREHMIQVLQNAIVGAEKGEFLNNAFSFKDGYVHTFKDFVSLSINLGNDYTFLKGSIRASEFYSLLTKYNTENVALEMVDNGIQLSSGRSSAIFTFLEESVLKQVETMELGKLEWKPIPPDFREAISFCILGAREYSLEGIRVQGDTVLSVDSKRINYYKMKGECGDFLIEEKVAIELLKFQDYDAFAQSDTRIFIRLKDGTIVSGRRKVDTEYPLASIIVMIDSLTPTETDPIGTLPKEFKQMISRASVLSIDWSGTSVVKIIFTPDYIECQSQRSTGKFEEKVDWEEKPKGLVEPVEVYLESNSTLYALQKSHTFVIKKDGDYERLIFIGDHSKCFLVAFVGDN